MSHVGSPELTPRQTSRNLPTSSNHGRSDLGEEVLNALETYKQKDAAKGDFFYWWISDNLPTSHRDTVVVRFKGVGNAPIMRQNMYKITATNRFQAVIQFLRKELGWQGGEPLVRLRYFLLENVIPKDVIVPLHQFHLFSSSRWYRPKPFQGRLDKLCVCGRILMSWTVFRNRWISYRQLQVSRGIQVRWQYFTSSLAPRPPGANFLFIRRHTVPSSPSVPYLSSNGIVGSLGWRKGAFRSILEISVGQDGACRKPATICLRGSRWPTGVSRRA